MAKQREAIGLDVGSQSVKMVRLEAKRDGVHLVDYKIMEYTQEEEGKAGAIREILTQSLRATAGLKDIGAVGQAVPIVVSVDGASVFIRVFKLPGVAKSKMAKIIAYEAQQQVPFPLEEVVWSYQCLRRVSPEETDVVLTAVRSSVIKDFLGSLGIDPSDIAPPVIGLNNLLSWSKYKDIQDPSGQAAMVLDLGAKTTNVIVVEGQNLWFRTIPIGGEAITQAISDEYSISFSNAELLKKEKGQVILEGEAEVDPDRKRMSTCIIKSLTRLTSEISRSIEVYSSSFNSLGPRKIFITGGGAGLGNIREFFNKKFRIDVDVLQIFPASGGISVSADIDKGKLSRDTQRLGTALGLALQGLGFGNIRLSLLPREILQRCKWLNRQAYLTGVSGLLVFLGVCFSGYNIQMAHIYRADISKLESERKALDFNKTKIMKTQKDLDIVKYRLDRVSEINDVRSFWSEMLLELELLIPDNVWLVGIEPVGLEDVGKPQRAILSDYKNYTAEITDLRFLGKTTGTYRDVVAFRDALDNSRYFVKDTGRVISANPPVNGVRDFVVEVKAKAAGGRE